MKHKRTAQLLLAGAAAVVLAGCSTVGSTSGGSSSGDKNLKPSDMTMVTVVKVQGIPWFDRMNVGVKKFAKDTGVDARQDGGDDATPEKQVAIIQDLIAQKPTAITVVPNSPESLETVLGQARKQGIIVVSHEAAGLKNSDIDIEAFDNAAYGAGMMDDLAKCMGGSGKYVAFVGHLTAKTHMEWVAGALDEAKKKYPGVTRVEDPIESNEDENVAYQKAKEILAKYPDIKGFEGSAGTDVEGIARAVEEAGKADSTCVMGTSTPQASAKYLADGSIDKIFFWDPAQAGYAQLKIAELLAQGQKITEGTDLGIDGYHSLKKEAGFDNVFVGDAAVVVDKSNVGDYDF